MNLPATELEKLPYVDSPPTDGRIVMLNSYYDHEADDWVLWTLVHDNQLGRIAGGHPGGGLNFRLELVMSLHAGRIGNFQPVGVLRYRCTQMLQGREGYDLRSSISKKDSLSVAAATNGK